MGSTAGRGNTFSFPPSGLIEVTRRVAPLGALTLLVGSVLSVVAFAMPSAQADTPVTLFSSSAPAYSPSGVTIPANVCFVNITASGGGGGASSSPLPGGAGATVSALVPVTAGEALSVLVGGVGGSQVPFIGGGAGGFGGG